MRGQLDLFEQARAERDAALAAIEAASSLTDREVIDRTIAAFASAGDPFSANDVRPWIPGVRRALIGARFQAAARQGVIRRTGYVPSTDPRTHAHPVAQWRGTTGAQA